mmetsp:Transcript_90265/g.264036  ORF Transcript_90265/g.264036 Transcript_90265/m.264036 type:complete len:722 (+) Transcript_90265:399-2564(+)
MARPAAAGEAPVAKEEPARPSVFEALLRQLAEEHERELNALRSEKSAALPGEERPRPLEQQQQQEIGTRPLEMLRVESNDGFYQEGVGADRAPRLLGSTGHVRAEDNARIEDLGGEDECDGAQVNRASMCSRMARTMDVGGPRKGQGPERPSIASDTSSLLEELIQCGEGGPFIRSRDVTALAGTWELQPAWGTEEEECSEDSSVTRLGEKKLYRMHLARARTFFLARNETAEIEKIGWQRCALVPYTFLWNAWQGAVTFLILMDAVIVPLQAFDDDETMNKSVERAALLTSSIWTLAIPLSCLVGYQSHDFIELRPWKIARRYATSWLPIDVLTVSSGWVEVSMTVEGSSMEQAVVASRLLKVFRLLRLIRLVRLYRLRQVSHEFQQIFHSQAAKVVFEVLRLMVGMVLINHMLACAWYAIGRGRSDGWILRYPEFVDSSLSHRYAAAYHWSLTQFHGASSVEAQNEIERGYSVVVLMMALFYVSIMLSTITNLMMQLQSESAAKLHRSIMLNRYLMQNKISSPLAVRVKKCMNWAEAKVERTGGEAFLHMLPSILQKELHYEICKPWISIHPLLFQFYRKFKRSFWHICIQDVTQYTVMPHEQIFREGLDSHYMMFITEGELSYSMHSCETVQLGPCRTICEASLWTHWVNIGVLATTEPACMLRLHSASFADTVLAQRPEVLRSTRAYAQRFVSVLRMLPASEISNLFTLNGQEGRER